MRWRLMGGWLAIGWVCAAVVGCAPRFSIEHLSMPPGSDAEVVVAGSEPLVEVRNRGEWIADLTVEVAGKTTIAGPTLPLPPGAEWSAKVPDGSEVRIHNRGDREAEIQLWTAGWTSLRVTLFPEGRGTGVKKTIVDEAGADGVYRLKEIKGGAEGGGGGE